MGGPDPSGTPDYEAGKQLRVVCAAAAVVIVVLTTTGSPVSVFDLFENNVTTGAEYGRTSAKAPPAEDNKPNDWPAPAETAPPTEATAVHFELQTSHWRARNVNEWARKIQPSLKGKLLRDIRHAKKSCARVEAGPKGAGYPEVLPKRAFNQSMRFVFVVGLEGTGHHLIETLFSRKRCRGDHHCRVDRCGSELVYEVMWHLARGKHLAGLFGANTTQQEANVATRALVSNLQQLAAQKREQPITFLINRQKCWNVFKSRGATTENHFGYNSYPDWGGACKSWQVPDARLLAEIFESVGIDLRILVLLRNGVDTLLSTVFHRRFGFGGRKQSQAWLRMAAMYHELVRLDILNQLMRIDSRFFRCLDYDALPDVPPEIGRFLGTDVAADEDGNGGWRMSDQIRRIFVAKNATQHDAELREVFSVCNTTECSFVATMLEAQIAKLRALCTRSSATGEDL